MEKNSLWKNIREKAKQNKATGAKPKKPTAAMLKQEAKIKAKTKNLEKFNEQNTRVTSNWLPW